MTAPQNSAHLRQVRDSNLSAVLQNLARRSGSRADLAQRTGLSKATIASLIEPLLSEGILVEGLSAGTGRGRPARPIRFHPEAPLAVGAEVSVGHFAVTLVALDGTIVSNLRVESDNRRRGAEELAHILAGLVRTTITDSARAVLGIGLAVPGIVSDATVLRAPNMTGLAGARIGELLAEALGAAAAEPNTVDIVVDNEANLAALAHLWPLPLATDTFIYVSGNIGIGAGIVADGTLYRGVNGFAGELGHVVIERSGRPCSCGNRGCVEQYAGLDAILRDTGHPDLDTLRQALRAGDARSRREIICAAECLGTALASVVNLCDITTIVLGGGYAVLFDDLAPTARAELDARAMVSNRRPVRILLSPLGIRAVAQGAAAFIIQRACAQPHRLTM